MLASILTPADLSRRAQLRQLAAKCTAPPPNFRIRGWRWHHLGVVRDLSRVESGLRRNKAALCSAGGSRVAVLDALRYIVQDNWELHNEVERGLFLPWLKERVGNEDARFLQGVKLVEMERERLEGEVGGLVKGVEAWVGGGVKGCGREVGGILDRVGRLKNEARVLFHASETVCMPRVAGLFSREEQVSFNNRVLKKIGGKRARVSLVVFADAVKQEAPVMATRQDQEDFRKDIPTAIRKWAMPYWRGKFVKNKMRFLVEGQKKG